MMLLDLTLAYFKGQIGGWNGVRPKIFDVVLCLYSLNLVVICQGQTLKHLIYTATRHYELAGDTVCNLVV